MTVLVTGPESTGKSRLAAELSVRLNIPFVSEYARSYLEKNGPDYNYQDLEIIAKQHFAIIQTHRANNDLILDTFLFNIYVWSTYKYGRCSNWVIDHMQYVSFDYVLLLKPDIPWENDPLRENPDNGEVLFNCFKDLFDQINQPYHIVSGLGDSRIENAIKAITN